MFVFYDTETTGLDRNFSQILQISLVFTDDDLNILSSKKLECRTSPWVVPSPEALLITGFVPDDLKFNTLSHYEMMNEINIWVREQHWPVTFVGYNSFGYDEPLLAGNFHQNLFDPGLTTAVNNSNGQSNGRADVMQMVKAAALYMPGVLKLDIVNGQGTPSVSLLNVAKQNGVPLSDGEAHDSMNDIKATIGVAKLIRKAAPQIWEQMTKLSTPSGVDAFLKSNEMFTVSSGRTSIVSTSVAGNTLYNLSIDPAPFMAMSAEQLKDVLLLPSSSKNPFTAINKTACPVMMPMDMSEAALPKKYDEKIYTDRAKAIRSNAAFAENLKKASLLAEQHQAATKKQAVSPELMTGEKIPDEAKPRLAAWIKEFHAAENWGATASLLNDFYIRFKGDLTRTPSLSRFVKFAARIVYEHDPQVLSAENQEKMKKYIARRILNPDLSKPYMTIPKAREEIRRVEQARAEGTRWESVSDSQIRSLKLYYTALEKEYAPHYAPPPTNSNLPAVPAQKNPPKAGGIQPK